MIRSIALLIIAATVTMQPQSAAAQSYEIRLARPAKVGYRYSLTATASQSEQSSVTVGESVIENKNEEFTAELVAEITVLEVGNHGGATKEQLKIDRCVITRPSGTTSLVEKGQVVVASVENGKEVFRLAGNPVEADLQKVLSLIVSLASSNDDEDDDDVFGTPEKRRIGDKWAINSKAAARSFGGTGLTIAPENVKGEVMLEGLSKIDQEDCLTIKGSLKMSKVAIPLPPGLIVERGEMDAQLSGKFPLDTSLPPLESSHQATISILARGKPESSAPEIKVSVLQKRSLTSRHKPLR